MADLSPPPSSMFGFVTNWLSPVSLFLLLNIMIGTIALASRFGSHNKPHEEGHPQAQHLSRAPSLLQRVKSIDFSFYKFPPGQQPEYATRDDPPQLERPPSLLQRVKSIDFFSYKFPPAQQSEYTSQDDPPQLERGPSLLQRVKSINFSSFYGSEPEETTQLEDETPSGLNRDWNSGSESTMERDHHVKRSKSEHMESTKKQQKMKKSVSEKAVASEDLDNEEVEREMVERRRPATSRLEKKVSFGDEGVDAKADDFINKFKQQLKLQRLDSLLRYKEMLNGKQKI